MKSRMIEKLMFGVIGVTTLGIVTVAGVQVVSLTGDGDTASAQQAAQSATPKAQVEEEVAPDVDPVSARTEASGRSDQAIRPVGDDDADDATQTPQPAPVQNQAPDQQPVNYDDDDNDDDDDRKDDQDDDDDDDDLDDQGDDLDDDGDDLYDD